MEKLRASVAVCMSWSRERYGLPRELSNKESETSEELMAGFERGVGVGGDTTVCVEHDFVAGCPALKQARLAVVLTGARVLVVHNAQDNVAGRAA